MISDSTAGSMGVIVNKPAINLDLKIFFIILKNSILKKKKNIQFIMEVQLNLIKDLYFILMTTTPVKKKLYLRII